MSMQSALLPLRALGNIDILYAMVLNNSTILAIIRHILNILFTLLIKAIPIFPDNKKDTLSNVLANGKPV